MKNKLASAAVLVLGTLAVAGGVKDASAAAGSIFSATGATINSGGPGFGSINDTFNHNGLLTGYTSEVTNFNAYMATNPLHTFLFSGYEWFSNVGTSSAVVTYDLGSVRSFDRVALWNEESSGIGLLNVLTSLDDVTYTSLATALSPTDNPPGNYPADVFSLAATARYVRFDMSGCPQPITSSPFAACAIGEVAFRTPEDNTAPEPTMLGLLGIGLAGLLTSRRRKAA